jgi:hypothetical protein
MRSVSATLKEAAFSQQTDVVFIYLVTITAPNLTQPILITSDSFELLPVAGGRGVVSRGDEYVYLPFELSLPNEDDTGIGRAKITIDNVSREIVQAVRGSSGKIGIKIEIVLSTDVDTPEVVLDNFILDSINYDALTVTGEISVQYYDLEPYPSRRFTPSDFPAMF